MPKVPNHVSQRKMENRQRAKGLFFMPLTKQRTYRQQTPSPTQPPLPTQTRMFWKKANGSLCKRPHHKLLHTEEEPQGNRATVTCVQDDSKVLLPTLAAKIKGSNGETTEANVFYDSGAQISMIRNSLAESLKLDSKPI